MIDENYNLGLVYMYIPVLSWSVFARPFSKISDLLLLSQYLYLLKEHGLHSQFPYS